VSKKPEKTYIHPANLHLTHADSRKPPAGEIKHEVQQHLEGKGRSQLAHHKTNTSIRLFFLRGGWGTGDGVKGQV